MSRLRKKRNDNAANEAEINAFVNNKTGAGSRERARVGLDRRDGGGATKSDADIALQPTSEKRSYALQLELVAISVAEKTILRKPGCRMKKIQRKKSVQAMSGNECTDSGDSINTVELDPSEKDTITYRIQDPDSYQPRLLYHDENKRRRKEQIPSRYGSHLQRHQKKKN